MPVLASRARCAAAALALTCALAACTRSSTERGTPQLSGAMCATCGGLINDERLAAQYRLSGGTVKSFDTPACLFRALHDEAGDPLVIRFRAYNADRWLAADQTWFARSPTITAPHSDGWAAFASFADAQDAVTSAGGGEILRFDQARDRVGVPAAQ